LPEIILAFEFKAQKKRVYRTVSFPYHIEEGLFHIPFLLFALFKEIDHKLIFGGAAVSGYKINPERQRHVLRFVQLDARVLEHIFNLEASAHSAPYENLGPRCGPLGEPEYRLPGDPAGLVAIGILELVKQFVRRSGLTNRRHLHPDSGVQLDGTLGRLGVSVAFNIMKDDPYFGAARR